MVNFIIESLYHDWIIIGLDIGMRGKLKELLDSQIAGLLSRIDEEMNSVHSDSERNDQIHPELNNEIQEEDDIAEQGSTYKIPRD